MDSVLNRIKVALYENFLTDDPNDLSAKVISERSLGIAEICRTAVNRGKAPTTPEAMQHNVEMFLKEMAFQLMNGFSVNTGYFTANAQVRGVFSHGREQFDPRKHSVLFRFNQGDILRKEIPKIAVQVVGKGESGIIISHVQDKKTGSVNDLITPGGALRIRGGKLKIAGANPDVGVYFEGDDGKRHKVGERDFIVNNPSELIVEIPQLTPGAYKLVISTQFSGSSTPLKEMRTAVYERIFTVQ